MCVLVQQGESHSLQTLLEIPLSGYNKLEELLAIGAQKSPDFSFPLTMVNGNREDDISVYNVDAVKREPGCFRSHFEMERCPAPFIYGSQFYCFHCPHTEPGSGLNSRKDIGLKNKHVDLPLLQPTFLWSNGEIVKGNHTEGDGEGEEKLAMMYERLRIEVRMNMSK